MYLSRLLHSIEDFVFPRECCGCGCVLAAGERLLCPRCAIMLPREHVRDWWSNSRIRPYWDNRQLLRIGAFAIYHRNNIAAQMVHCLKFRQRWQLGVVMGRMAGRELRSTGLFDDVEMLLPIPIALSRRWSRGYNQSEFIAEGLSAETGVPVRRDLIYRRRHRESQTHFSILERQQVPTDLFALRPGAAEALRGHCVMLVDDVITTGATMFSAITTLCDVPDVRIVAFGWSWTGMKR